MNSYQTQTLHKYIHTRNYKFDYGGHEVHTSIHNVTIVPAVKDIGAHTWYSKKATSYLTTGRRKTLLAN